ncbi:recombination-associated protein RdgC [Chitinimonas koreensis]|uniref:recombination-associated protein RdgC n=1 Tax=Chitinimonas koreensis TaxID=356302 RepID=UPI0004190273|nr:recombination-associated protein RdgC [Chitinimonas koreensis]QNM94928.1 recombination-associated protein RdgC [Chitinimonas koreensis]
MWFKNLQPYRITDPTKIDLANLDAELKKRSFVPAGTTDRMVAGWIPPAPHTPDVFAYTQSGAALVALKTEEKLLPPSVVKEAADKRAAEIEAKELRKLGKKELKEIRERIAEELLPRAFSRSRVLRAVIDPVGGWIWIDSSAPAKAEQLVQFLRETLGSLPTKRAETQLDPVTAMSTWLEHGAPPGYSLDDRVRLNVPGTGGGQVACSGLDLNADEVKSHLKTGKVVRELALTWGDRIAFVLTEKLQLKRLQFLDLLQDQIKQADAEDAAALFDACLALQILEGRAYLAAVIEALGGELGQEKNHD